MLVVYPTGKKVWKYRYRFGGKERELSIGPYPAVSLAAARDGKVEALKLLSKNLDPSLNKQHEKRLAEYLMRSSFHAVAKEWYETNQDLWSNRHADRIWARLENHVFPQLGTSPVSEIKPMDVLGAVRKVEANGTRYTAKRTLQLCDAVFRYARLIGLIVHNPAERLQEGLKPHRTKSYPTIPSSELGDFLGALNSLNSSEQNRIAFRILLHTAVRTGELRWAEWSEIYWDEKIWIIPAEKMKMRRDHLVPLSEQVVGLLERLRQIATSNQYLFSKQQAQKHPVMSENLINLSAAV